MRKILFRGKRVDNGEWVEGHYYQRWKGLDLYSYIIVDNMYEHRVIPETVCQYVGITNNGINIFEGDIVNVFGYNGISHYFEVIYTDEDVASCGCCYKPFCGIGFVFQDAKGNRATNIQESTIVGNIYDNPQYLDMQLLEKLGWGGVSNGRK